ncbi:5-hydroxytryptamine receptor 4 [Biomphalaria pfeifferi]|uniref:5-hydroxytryptamine receptor 4 n=1 Tax=Biomphalaria pfeifferi TaxID=112525 RepID=A0AAD8EVT5_BIOPF|nr:5-hydroxytryptamine receptor 4 [Biomphalaria pfeifferi]
MNTTSFHDICSTNIKSQRLLTAVAVLLSVLAAYTLLANLTVFLAMAQTLLKGSRRAITSDLSHNKSSYINALFDIRWRYSGSFYNAPFDSGTTHIVFMAIDTFLVVCKPLIYRLLAARTGYVLVALAWLLPISVILPWGIVLMEVTVNCNASLDNVFSLNMFCGSALFSGFTVMWVLYLFVVKDILMFRKRHLQKRSSDNSVFRTFQSPPSTIPVTSSNVLECNSVQSNEMSNTQVSLQRFRGNLRCFQFIGIIMLSFSVCWIPSIFNLTFGSVTLRSGRGWIYIVVNWLAYFSSSVNPVLYCTNKTIKRAVINFIT